MILSGLVAAAAFGWAAAQADDGWDVVADPARDRVAAGVQFGGGVSFAVQCQAGQLTVALGGMPTTDASIRHFDATRGGGASRLTWWNTHPGSPVLTSTDVRAVRFLRAGGNVTFASAAGEARPSRMQIELPTNPAGLDQVLTACGSPLVDPRDALTDVGDLLLEGPRVEIFGDLSRYPAIRVEISCVVRGGKMADCQSDHETPSAPQVGRETARHANGYPLKLSDPAAAEGRIVEVVVTGSRIRRPIGS